MILAFYDLGGIDIADDVMIGPNVSIITSGHPLEPLRILWDTYPLTETEVTAPHSNQVTT